MTIDELLKLAQATCHFMDMEMGRDRGTLERAAQYGTVAQGYALTTIAMIQAARWTERQADNDREELRATQDYEILGWREGRPSADAPF